MAMMNLRVGRLLGVLSLLLIAAVALANAESVTIKGRTGVYCAPSFTRYPQYIFYSDTSLPVNAWITVLGHQGNTVISVDGTTYTVTDGSTYGPAKDYIRITAGVLYWKMKVKLNPPQGLTFDGVLKDVAGAPPHKKGGKLLFRDQWNPKENWVVIFVKVSVSSVDFLDYDGGTWPIWLTLYTGDHVLSLSSIGKSASPCHELWVRMSGVGLEARMWKWKK